jgi:hypothetical protein
MLATSGRKREYISWLGRCRRSITINPWGANMFTHCLGEVRHARAPSSVFARLATLLLLAGLVAGGATTQTVSHVSKLTTTGEKPRILLMTPDVKYYLLTAGGLTEPHADWTAAAQRNFVAAVQGYATERGSNLIVMDSSQPLGELESQYARLHGAVGNTVLANYFSGPKLPTKGETFDWSLGPGVSTLGERYGADYALFSFYRDFQASGGRMAFAVVAAMAGVGISTGGQGGFASLVDLKTGEIVWFNLLQAGTGDLRSPEGAHAVMAEIFKDLPRGDGLAP